MPPRRPRRALPYFFTRDQLASLAAWFEKQGVTQNCAACGRDDAWSEPFLVLNAAVDAEGNPSTTHGSRNIHFACRNCGFIRVFAGQILGL